MERIQQEDVDGCLVACIAMVTGRTYAEIRAICEPGISQIAGNELLARFGYATICRYRHDPLRNQAREPWPCEPFAPIHIAYVNVAAGHHAVVVLESGKVLDPWKAERTELTHPDYRSIDHIDGVYRVT